MFGQSIRRASALRQIKKYAGENCEITLTLRNHSRILGCAPIIVGGEQFQFCSLESGSPIVLPLDKIWSIAAR
jgi:hypothetical protein